MILAYWCALCHRWFRDRAIAREHDCRYCVRAEQTAFAKEQG